jgi:hypothetical protein
MKKTGSAKCFLWGTKICNQRYHIRIFLNLADKGKQRFYGNIYNELSGKESP